MEHIDKALADFAAGGQDLSRRRFSRSPPRVSSVPSTKYDESESPSPNALLQDKESEELINSDASEQFKIQILDEQSRIRAARDKNLLQHPLFDLQESAEANVKYRWIQQGIWDDRWVYAPLRLWKHELQDPLLRRRPSDPVEEGGATTFEERPNRKHSVLKEEYLETVRCAVDYQNRESSRPCYQFVYQFCQEREWIKMGLSEQDQDQQTDLDTRAYDAVKSRWIREGIWDDDWISIPGTSWRYERPRKAPDPQGLYRWEDDRKAARIERDERAPRWYTMAPAAPLMRIDWFSRRPDRFEASPDPTSPQSNPEAMPHPRDRSIELQTHTHTNLPGYPHKSTPRAKPNTGGQGHSELRTNLAGNNSIVGPTSTNLIKKVPRKRKINTSQPGVAELDPVTKRTPANKRKSRPQIPAARRRDTANDTTTSRPRRAAALKAMKNMA